MERHTTRYYGNSRKRKRHGDDRICKTDGCNTRLSAYNPSPFCYQHARRKRPRIRNIPPR